MFWESVLQVLMSLFLLLIVLPGFIAGLVALLVFGRWQMTIEGWEQ